MTFTTLPGWAGAFALLVVGACTYDFEAPFAETPVGGGAGGAGGLGGAGGGPGGTTTSGTGGQSGGEQCGNGTDDDGDDLIDCEDSDCADHACVEPPPDGWTLGTFAVSTDGHAPPDCGAGWPSSSEANAGLSAAPDAQCACSCSSPTVTCSLASTNYADSINCQWAQLGVLTPSANGACDSIPTLSGADANDGIEGEAVTVQSASCNASEGSHILPAVTWTDQGRLCEGVSLGGGCEDGQACVPATPTSFSLCISRSGDHQCPAPHTDKTLRYADVNDSRSCDCSCGPPANAACTASTEVWPSSGNCQGNPSTIVDNDGSCVTFAGPPSNGSFQYTATPSSDPCPVQDQPTGEATPTGAVTVCCLP